MMKYNFKGLKCSQNTDYVVRMPDDDTIEVYSARGGLLLARFIEIQHHPEIVAAIMWQFGFSVPEVPQFTHEDRDLARSLMRLGCERIYASTSSCPNEFRVWPERPNEGDVWYIRGKASAELIKYLQENHRVYLTEILEG